MTVGLTPFQESVRTNARAVARDVTAKFAARHDAEYTVPMETLDALHRVGLCIDRKLGGNGTGMLTGVDALA